MSLGRKTAKNSFYNVLAYVWPIGLAFFTTPIILHHLGNSLYGIFALASAFVGFFAVLDLGVAPSLVKYFSEYKAKEDQTWINRIYSSAIVFYAIIGMLGTILIAATAHPFAALMLRHEPYLQDVAFKVFLISAVGFLVNMLLSTYASIPQALQRYDISGRINIVLSTLSYGGAVAVVLTGHGIVALVSLGVIASVLSIAINNSINHRLLPALRFRPHIDTEAFKKIFSFSGYALMASLSGIIIAQFDRLLLGAWLGPKDLTYYAVPGNLTTKIFGMIGAIAGVLFPVVSELLVKQDYERLAKIYLRATRVVVFVLVLGLAPMLVYANKFLLYWVGPDLAIHSTLVLQLLILTYGVGALHAIPFLTSYGSGKPKYAAYYSLAVAALNVAFMFLLIPRFGIVGAAWAFLIAEAPTTIAFMLVVETRIIKLRQHRLHLRSAAKFAILTAFALFVSFLLLPLIHSLITFLLCYGVTLAAVTLFYVASRLANTEDVQFIRSLLQRPS